MFANENALSAIHECAGIQEQSTYAESISYFFLLIMKQGQSEIGIILRN
jgi:hypothetical protein